MRFLNSEIILFLSFLLTLASGSFVFDAYRVAQYDRAGVQLGSRRVQVNHVADLYKQNSNVAENSTRRRSEFTRKTLVIPINELSSAQLLDIESKGAGSVLILIPSDISSVSADKLKQWREAEKFLLSRTWESAIYIAFEDDNLQNMLKAIEAGASKSAINPNSHHYHLSFTGTDASTPTTPITLYNYQAWDYTSANDGNIPTVAIVTSYDSYGAAPGLSYGVDTSGSGVVAILEIARIFSRLYADVKTVGKFNLLFVLTSGAAFNYHGAKQWSKSADNRIVESIDFVLCLENLGGVYGDALYLHTTKPGKKPEVSELYQNFEQTAQSMSIPFEIKVRKINSSDPAIFFQHEQFARKKMFAMTLSGSPVSDLTRFSIFDQKNLIKHHILERNIKFVVEVLVKQLYNLKDKPLLDVASGSLSPTESRISAWIEFLGSTPRSAPYLTKESPFFTQLEKALASYTTEYKRLAFSLDPSLSFYITPLKSELTAFEVKHWSFDVVLSISTGVYLGLLYLILRVWFR